MGLFPKRRFALKYKLSFLLIFVVVIVATFLGVQQLILTRNTLSDNFEQGKQLVKDRILNHVRDIDNMYLLVEKPLESEAQTILEKVSQAYEENGSINFDLAPYVWGKKDYDLYIINEDDIVVATTDEADIGLNFKLFPGKSEKLDEMRESKRFFPDRVDLSSLKSIVKKYCYLPSRDGKYIFEIGIGMAQFSGTLRGQEFGNIEGEIPREYDFVNRVTMYDERGYGYKQNDDGQAVTVQAGNIKYFEQALDTGKTVEFEGVYDGAKVTFMYVPYNLMDAVGMNINQVIEIVYNDFWLQDALEKGIGSIIVSITVGSLVAVVFAFYLARKVTKPIEKLTEATRELSKGNFDIRTNITTNDEFRILGLYFDKMARDISTLLQERYQYEADLKVKNNEIFQQKEEIGALYEETTAINGELETLLTENQNSYFETVMALANSVEAMDAYTGGHCERVMEYSVEIAYAMRLSADEIRDIRFGSILHDIGKIGIPGEVLNKADKYTAEDYETMKKHPVIGHAILKDVHFLENGRKIVLEHHERMDGKGYPNGIKGEEIDLLSRIVCVADAYDAMTSNRPYRSQPFTKEEAIAELIRNKGTQFDPQIVDVFIKILNAKN